MAQTIPKICTKFDETVGTEIFITFPFLETNTTFIKTDSSSSATTFSVENGLKFAVKQYIKVGLKGNEEAEILRTHDSTTPTATTITLDATASSFAHNRGDEIQFMPFNQVVIEKSTDGTTYTVLDTIDINAASEETYYNYTTGLATDYYRARFKNETDTTYSTYSDGIIATGFVASSAGSIIRKALVDLGEEIDGTLLTKEFLYNALNEGRREIDEDERIIRWSFRTVFNYNAYSIIPGQYKFTLPTDLRYSDTDENILSVRVGKDKDLANSIDQTSYDNYYIGVSHTTLNGAVTTTDTDIVLTESGDMTSSGSITVAAQAVDEETDTITYETAEIEEITIAFVEGGASADTITDSGSGFLDAGFFDGQQITVSGSTSNDGTYRLNTAVAGTLTLIASDDLTNESAAATVKIISTEANVVADNTLTGVSGIRALGHATLTDVWQGVTFGQPQFYTVDNSIIYFTNPFQNSIAGETIELDYYKGITDVNSDADLLDEPFYNIYIPYLRYKIKLKKDENLNWKNDPDYIKWVQMKDAQISKEYYGQNMRIVIDVPC